MAVQIRPGQVQPGSNGQVLTTTGGVAAWGTTPGIPTHASDLTTVVVPTVVTVAGTPELLYDADDNLVLVEVSYP